MSPSLRPIAGEEQDLLHVSLVVLAYLNLTYECIGIDGRA
jgi:hypothetical protein